MNDSPMRILLTGASGEIGRSIYEKLQASGHDICAPTSQELNLKSQDSVFDWLTRFSSNQFQAVVLAAGINNPEALFENALGNFDEIQKVNFLGNQMLLSHIVPKMVENNFGRIVSISSAYSQLARKGRAAYSISKASMDALIRSIAVEYGTNNVLANSIAPGFIDTIMTRRNNNDLQISQILARVPVARLGTPEQIARTTIFLLSSENTYITGQRINVDGGFSIN